MVHLDLFRCKASRTLMKPCFHNFSSFLRLFVDTEETDRKQCGHVVCSQSAPWSCDPLVCFRRRRTRSPKLQRGRGKDRQPSALTVTDGPITRQLPTSRSDHWKRPRPLPLIRTDRHGRGGALRCHVGTDFHMRLITDQRVEGHRMAPMMHWEEETMNSLILIQGR